MQRLKWAIFAVGALIALGALVSLFLPSGWEVERSARIGAEPARIAQLVASAEAWEAWAPWPRAGAPAARAGADGDAPAPPARGRGRPAIVAAEAHGVRYEVAIAGLDAPAEGSLSWRREAGRTLVVWRDRGEVGRNPVARLLLFLLEGQAARDVERGLASLARAAEAR